MKGRRLLPAAAAACIAALASTGCSPVPTSTLDRASVQQKIATYLAMRYDVPRPTVACHGELSGRVGARFRCTTALAGSPVTVTGTVADSTGRFGITLNRAVIDASRASHVLEGSLRSPGQPIPAVSCGRARLRVMAPGGTFTCTATDGGVTTTVTGTASDLQGDVRFSVGVPSTSSDGRPGASAPVTTPAAVAPVTTEPAQTTTTTTPTPPPSTTSTTLSPVTVPTTPSTTVVPVPTTAAGDGGASDGTGADAGTSPPPGAPGASGST